ncbi:MAG: organic solvent ABC transporter ATP-binding protein [Proteobacteria bacterium]|nr:organic solvent ABC transporter ATP-binding protein [Pseudomonadota bacterium]
MTSILTLTNVIPTALFGAAGRTGIDFNLEPGELALVNARDLGLVGALGDLCCGLKAIDTGTVRFLDQDWTTQPRDRADALRGHIGRVLAHPAWLDFLSAAENILLGRLYHTRRATETLRTEAAELARHFGMPGLPTGQISDLSPDDLTRAGLVRAFLGAPRLVILESPVQGAFSAIVPALLNRLAMLRDSGGAALWVTRSRLVWDNRTLPASHRWRLDHTGLTRIG